MSDKPAWPILDTAHITEYLHDYLYRAKYNLHHFIMLKFFLTLTCLLGCEFNIIHQLCVTFKAHSLILNLFEPIPPVKRRDEHIVSHVVVRRFNLTNGLCQSNDHFLACGELRDPAHDALRAVHPHF